MLRNIKLTTQERGVTALTDDVKAVVEESGVQEGLCVICIDFKHQHDTPQDAAGHVKSSLIGVNLTIPIHQGKLLLGHSQGIYFLEFDGPRKREYFVKVQADGSEG